ncbi:hypothetical protein OUZ56_017659 [Daphnia magna]|uniref:Uncharacterized protein n=1 Tax=Daphnia magna TaxID=35525 RepID=A0ABR0ATE5_9CRUS|nr:hypothetical protein OUZ56_017659 [Daphnia magna]
MVTNAGQPSHAMQARLSRIKVFEIWTIPENVSFYHFTCVKELNDCNQSCQLDSEKPHVIYSTQLNGLTVRRVAPSIHNGDQFPECTTLVMRSAPSESSPPISPKTGNLNNELRYPLRKANKGDP